jgi:D-threo-aldose 1-dehydrogenase
VEKNKIRTTIFPNSFSFYCLRLLLVFALSEKIDEEDQRHLQCSVVTVWGVDLGMVRVIYGTSVLGNLYEDLPYEQKKKIIREILLQRNQSEIVTFDCAGKYGAGLALETLGKILTDLQISSNRIQISNKLGWRRKPFLPGQTEPTFERGIWMNLQYDAVLDISYEGIMNAYHEGNGLLGNCYKATLVSIHDPDEYLQSACDETDLLERMNHLSEAYRALFELKASGEVESVGVGSKDYKIIQYISNKYPLDWVMTACALTPFIHPSPHLVTLQSLSKKGSRHLLSLLPFLSSLRLSLRCPGDQLCGLQLWLPSWWGVL